MTNRDAPVPKASVGEVFIMTFIMAAVSGLGAVRKFAGAPASLIDSFAALMAFDATPVICVMHWCLKGRLCCCLDHTIA